MKKTLILIVLIILFKTSQEQSYIPLPMENAIWRVDFNGDDPNIGCMYCNFGFQNLTSGDTIINSLSYTKIIKTGAIECSFPCIYLYENGYMGAIRQDTIGRKIYIVKPFSSIEKILYDFTQNIGDTLNSILVPSVCDPEIITVIDSVLIGSVYHKRFITAGGTGCNPMGTQIIEGIGSNHGLLDSLYSFEWGFTLICVNHNNQTIYPDLLSGCLLVTSINSEIKQDYEISIAPNPFKDYFEINLSKQFDNIELTLYDMLGRELISTRQNRVEKIKVLRDDLNAGFYFYQLKSNNCIISNGKIIAE